MRFRIAVLTVTVTLLSLGSFAETYYGGIRGTILDPSGQVVVNASVRLKNDATNVERTVATNTTGEYVFSSLDPASYTITVVAPGFKPLTHSGLIVSTQEFLTLDLSVNLGTANDSVLVTADLPLVDNSNASNGQVINTQKLADLPNLGRNPFLFSKLNNDVAPVGDPRFNRFQDQSGSSQISIAGGPIRGNNYLIDGVPITDSQNRAVIIPSIEATEEVKVQANTYDAEIGRTGGGVFNTTLKSGTNSLHGSLLGYTRQTDWLANNYFLNRSGTTRPDTPFYNYGGSISGPVIIPKLYNGKNKTFFFMAAEGYRQKSPLTNDFAVPTALERRGDFSQSFDSTGKLIVITDPITGQPYPGNVIPVSKLNPIGLAIAAAYPLPNKSGVRYAGNNYAGSDILTDRADEGVFKLDHKFFSWWKSNASYLHYGSREPGGNPLQSIAGTGTVSYLLYRKVDAFQLNNTILVDPSTVLNIGFGFNRFPNNSLDTSNGFDQAILGLPASYLSKLQKRSFPAITMANFAPIGTSNSGPSVFYSRTVVAGLSKALGKQSLKGGIEFRSISVDFTDLSYTNGSFTFGTDFKSGNDLVNLLEGFPSSGYVTSTTRLATNVPYYAGYLQDDYRITERLTLNLGLRYEWEGGLSERQNHYAVGFDPNVTNPLQATSRVTTKGGIEFAAQNGYPTTCCSYSNKKFAPRVGGAYALNSKTVVRLGYGIFYAPVSFTNSSSYAPGYTQTSTYVASNDGLKTPAGSLSNPFPTGVEQPVGNSLGYLTGVGSSLTTWWQGAKSPMVQQYSFDIQRELPFGVGVQVGYVGALSQHLLPGNTINVDQLPDSYLSLGSQLSHSVANPYYGTGGIGVIGGSTVAYNQLLRPFPEFSSVNVYHDTAHAKYGSLNIKAQKRFAKGLTFLTTYTWSKNEDSTWAASNFLNASQTSPQDVYNLSAEWSRSVVDIPHRFTAATTYDLPIGKGQRLSIANPVLNLFVGNWSLNTVTIFQSGSPMAIYQNINNNKALGTFVQRPNLTGMNPCYSGSPEGRLDSYLNPAAFSTAPAFTYGNAPRAINCLSPGYTNWDISLFKSFPILERVSLQFRAEALNAFNTPQFRAPNMAFGNANFGHITQQANYPRYIQLGGRISF